MVAIGYPDVDSTVAFFPEARHVDHSNRGHRSLQSDAVDTSHPSADVPAEHADPIATPASLALLVVEDSEDDFALLEATLIRQGVNARCTRVETGDEMAAMLRTESFDAVISDHHLPGFSSEGALRVLQSSGLGLPFVIVSGTIGEETAVAALHAGADDYLVKGRLARLSVALAHAIERARARRERDAAEAALRASQQRLQELSAHLQRAIEEERATIARDIHDEIGSGLASLRFDLAWIEANTASAVACRAAQARGVAAELMQASQRIVRNLRPPVLDAGLVAALEWQVARFRERSQLQAAFRTNTAVAAIPEATAIVAYRCVQEALANILKHAHASRVEVDLVVQPGQLSLEISDDGQGIAPQALEAPTGFGLKGLAERARQAGGWLEVDGATDGATLMLCLPLDPAELPA